MQFTVEEFHASRCCGVMQVTVLELIQVAVVE